MAINVQTMLSEMRAESREDHATLVLKIDTGFSEIRAGSATIASDLRQHTADDALAQQRLDGRLASIEGNRKTLRWLGGCLVIATLGFLSDMLVNHLPLWFHHP